MDDAARLALRVPLAADVLNTFDRAFVLAMKTGLYGGRLIQVGNAHEVDVATYTTIHVQAERCMVVYAFENFQFVCELKTLSKA